MKKLNWLQRFLFAISKPKTYIVYLNVGSLSNEAAISYKDSVKETLALNGNTFYMLTKTGETRIEIIK